MPTSPIKGFRFPPLTGVTPDVPRDLENLTDDLDAYPPLVSDLTPGSGPIPNPLPTGYEVDFHAAMRIVWRLRYTGTEWAFLGGAPITNYAADQSDLTSTGAWQTDASDTSITVPTTGMYVVALGIYLEFRTPMSGAPDFLMGYSVNGVNPSIPSTQYIERVAEQPTTVVGSDIYRRLEYTPLDDGDVLLPVYRPVTAVGTYRIDKRLIELLPLYLT
jgi:hypothetical protein